MTKIFNLSEAKDQLSSLVDRAASGEEIVIAKHVQAPLPEDLRKAFGIDP